ncbi:MAG TPA: hypothetical protein VNN73_15595 [Blastocatellia bacterium]|nr:hypothetical protein [Blastocatellia bacterium]
MPKRSGQREIADYIRSVLSDRGFRLPSSSAIVEQQQWIVFKNKGRAIGIDRNGGIWVRESGDKWRCIEKSGKVGAALEAVEFLLKD